MRETTRPTRPRSLTLLAVAVSGLVFTVPLLGLNCEMACARIAARAATAEDAPPPAEHCAAHGDASPGRPSGAPATPDGCGHHADSAVVKRAAEGAVSGCKISILAGSLPAPIQSASDRYSVSSAPTVPGATPRPAAARPRILRL